MNICILTPRFPFPQYGGDALRINEIARHLKLQGHKLILVSLSDEKVTPIEKAHELYDRVYFINRNRIQSLIMGAATKSDRQGEAGSLCFAFAAYGALSL